MSDEVKEDTAKSKAIAAEGRSGAEKDKGDKNSVFSNFFGGKKTAKKKKIIIAAAAAVVALLPIIIFITLVGGITGSYGSTAIKRTSQGEDAADVLQDFYDAYCKNDENECTAEQKAVLESQTEFFERLNEIGKKFNLSDKQKYIIYKTIIYDFDIGEFLSGQAFDIDKESDEKDEEDENLYESGKDTIKFLAKKFDGSEDKYYNYLLENDYFEGKVNYKNAYQRYAKPRNLNVNYVSSWSIEDRKAVRERIVNDIRDSANSQYPEKKATYFTTYNIDNPLWWWPIGGATVENVSSNNGTSKFSYDNPLFTRISSYFGYRTDPVTGVKNKYHSGIDIPARLNSPVIAARAGTVTAITNECRTKSSTESDRACGGTYGNHIKIKTDDGYEYIYGHLAQNTITVSVNDRVEQGQVVANVGSSGKSTGYHLHVSIKTPNGNYVNPLDYFDPSNPRPVDEFADLFRFIEYNENGTSLSNAVECGLDGLATTRYGMLLKHRVQDYANHGYTLVDVPVYKKDSNGNLKLRSSYSNYCRDIESKGKAFDKDGNPSSYESLIKIQYFDSEIPLEVTQAVYRDLMAYWSGYIKKKAAKYEIELNKQQVDALVSLAWSGYEAVNKFFGEDIHGKACQRRR